MHATIIECQVAYCCDRVRFPVRNYKRKMQVY